MAIRLITGVPGAGKTFYAVKHLVDNYFDCDPVSGVYRAKEGVTVITNIESLRLPTLDLDEIMKASGKVIDTFFTVPFQTKVLEKYPHLVYMIDECQRFFPYRYSNRDVLYFFEYHRHLGIDIYLLTQSSNLLAHGLRELCEVEIRAIRRTASVFGALQYRVISAGENIDRKILRRDKKIFDLYVSMVAVEKEKIRNPLVRYILILFVLAVGAAFLFYRTFLGHFGMSDTSRGSAVAAVPPSLVAPASVVPSSRPAVSSRVPLVPVALSWIEVGGRLMVVEPQAGRLLAADELPYPVQITRGSSLRVDRMQPYEDRDAKTSPPRTLSHAGEHRPRPCGRESGRASACYCLSVRSRTEEQASAEIPACEKMTSRV